MKLFILFFFFIALTSCKDKKFCATDIELVALNDTLYSCDFKSINDTINIVSYYIHNNSNKLYFINNIIETPSLFLSGINKEGFNLTILDSTNTDVDYINRQSKSNFCTDSLGKNYVESIGFQSKSLGYYNTLEYFKRSSRDEFIFLHPHEKLYFECFINISKPVKSNGIRRMYAVLQKNTVYNAQLKITNDSSNYKYVLPRNILKSIKFNHAIVYHGIIKSKKQIPIKILE